MSNANKTYLLELVKQAPATVAVIIVVTIFLNYQKGHERVISDVSAHASEVIEANTAAIGSVQQTLYQVDRTMERVEDCLERHHR